MLEIYENGEHNHSDIEFEDIDFRKNNVYTYEIKKYIFECSQKNMAPRKILIDLSKFKNEKKNQDLKLFLIKRE